MYTNLKNLNINTYNNVTKILGILLDNAIDASKKCNKKEVTRWAPSHKDVDICRGDH